MARLAVATTGAASRIGQDSSALQEGLVLGPVHELVEFLGC
jgi:hypothetical protein